MVNWTSVSTPASKSIEPSTLWARRCEMPIFERKLPSARKSTASGVIFRRSAGTAPK